MLMANENALAGPAHAMLLVVLLQSFQPRKDRRIFLRLCLLGTESVIAEREESNGLWLVVAERFRDDWPCQISVHTYRGCKGCKTYG